MSKEITKLLAAQEEFLNIHVELTPEQAIEWARRTGGYNEFDPAKVEFLIRAVNTLVPPMNYGPNNPNTGHPHHKWVVGREGSMVLYLRIIETYLPKDFDHEGFEKRLKKLAEEALADEYSYQRRDPAKEHWDLKVRFWWD